MSCLVNYGSSDESESSDTEDVTSVAARPKKTDLKPQDTNKPSSSVPKKPSLFASLPKPKAATTPATEETGSSRTKDGMDVTVDTNTQKKSLFSSLPPPKKATTKLPPDAAKMTPQVPNQLNPMPKSSPATDGTVSIGLLNLPPPKKKQPVKISLPALPDPDSDDEPEKKRPRSTKGTGLFSLLPKPRIASRKEAQRPLIPYTLTKKPAAAPVKTFAKSPTKPVAQLAKTAEPSTSTVVTNQPSSSNPLVMGYNSDEDDDDDADDEGINFFSMGESDNLKARTSAEECATTNVQSILLAPSASISTDENKRKVSEIQNEKSRTESGTSPDFEDAPEVEEPSIPTNQDQPLVFNSSKSNTSGYSRSNCNSVYNLPYNAQSSDSLNYVPSKDGSMQYGSYNQTGLDTQEAGMQYYNQPYVEGSETVYEQNESAVPSISQTVLQDKQFAKMVGKKNRGREEIQFIDIKADDQIGSTAGLQHMVKSMTEEKEYRGKLKKEQLPTSQQKRKHQITYLARQAKERELELKNQWAENRQNRKSTNAKYGFF